VSVDRQRCGVGIDPISRDHCGKTLYASGTNIRWQSTDRTDEKQLDFAMGGAAEAAAEGAGVSDHLSSRAPGPRGAGRGPKAAHVRAVTS